MPITQSRATPAAPIPSQSQSITSPRPHRSRSTPQHQHLSGKQPTLPRLQEGGGTTAPPTTRIKPRHPMKPHLSSGTIQGLQPSPAQPHPPPGPQRRVSLFINKPIERAPLVPLRRDDPAAGLAPHLSLPKGGSLACLSSARGVCMRGALTRYWGSET